MQIYLGQKKIVFATTKNCFNFEQALEQYQLIRDKEMLNKVKSVANVKHISETWQQALATLKVSSRHIVSKT